MAPSSYSRIGVEQVLVSYGMNDVRRDIGIVHAENISGLIGEHGVCRAISGPVERHATGGVAWDRGLTDKLDNHA